MYTHICLLSLPFYSLSLFTYSNTLSPSLFSLTQTLSLSLFSLTPALSFSHTHTYLKLLSNISHTALYKNIFHGFLDVFPTTVQLMNIS